MMQVWHFSEMAYHPAWQHLDDTYRVIIPSRLFDPKVGADLYHRYLDEWALCDELGINIMTNEHHATATCADSVCTIPMAILARETKKVRLLALGMPIGNRNDPIRVAEEYSMIDVISRGRVEMGFVKGVPFEISPANTNPAELMERFWEAHDLILKAMSSHDGPFSWEGTHFHYRSVNVWPRPWQQPHPPVWMPVGSPGSAEEAAARGITIGVLNTGWVRTPAIFDAYRKKAAEAGREMRPDKLLGVQPHLRHRRAAIPEPAGLCRGRAQRADAEGGRLGRRTGHQGTDQGWPPDQRAHNAGRGGDRRRPRLRRHPGRCLGPAEGVLRPCRRVRTSVDDGPGRPSRPRRQRRQPDDVQPRGAAKAGGIGVKATEGLGLPISWWG